jgi:hypothetical protein
MSTSKSPKAVLTAAYRIGVMMLPFYAHRFSPKKFTQPQLFACLVFKEFMLLDYRKLAETLHDAPDLCSAIELQAVPHFTTFQKAAKRLLRLRVAGRMIGATVRWAQDLGLIGSRVRLAALDGTGFESHHSSSYYVQRRAKGSKSLQKTTYARFPKAGIVCDTASHLILSIVVGQGPGPDIKHFQVALDQAIANIPIDAVAADAGYDSEASHLYAREWCGVRSLIPPKIGRPTAKPPTGYWRRKMRSHLKQSRYGQRWQIETVNSMLKRLLGSALRARSYWSRCRELMLRAITLNAMILARHA